MDIGSYFEKNWRPEFSKYKYSGWALLNKVSLKDRLLDVGCGYNLFKPIFRDAMVGIDPYNDAADIRVSIEDYQTDEQFDAISEQVNALAAELRKLGISVKYDNRDTQKPGFKFAEWELKGVPVRIALGPNDLENGTYEIARRDNLSKEVVSKEGVASYIQNLLETIQNDMFAKALDYRDTHITEVNSFEEFKELLETKGGFLAAHWDGTAETEEKIKELTKATIRCIALDRVEEAGSCVFTGAPSKGRVLFAKAY